MNQGTCPECGAVMTENHRHNGDMKMEDKPITNQMVCPKCNMMVEKAKMPEHEKMHQSGK